MQVIDAKTVESVIRENYREMYMYCFSRLLDKQVVEDVVQEIFVTLQEQSGELEQGNLRTWLYKVAHRKVMEAQRDEVRRSRLVSYDAGRVTGAPIAVDDLVEMHMDEEIDVDDVKRRILQKLTPEERELFEAVYEKHIKRKVLAEQMNISENALNVRVHRLRSRIMRLIETVMMIAVFIAIKCR